MKRLYVWLMVISVIHFGCSDQASDSPRPRAYPKVHYPEYNWVEFNDRDCPFTFRYPDYMEIRKDKDFFGAAPPHDCWLDLHIPAFGADIHCTYSPIKNYNAFQMMVQDAFRFANEQNRRANYIEDFKIQLPNGVGGMAFNMEGPSASPFQFFLTDSTTHFFRGSVYFNTRPNPDSLAPVAAFVKADLMQIIASFSWQ